MQSLLSLIDPEVPEKELGDALIKRRERGAVEAGGVLCPLTGEAANDGLRQRG